MFGLGDPDGGTSPEFQAVIAGQGTQLIADAVKKALPGNNTATIESPSPAPGASKLSTLSHDYDAAMQYMGVQEVTVI